MKILIISDTHGMLFNLQRVLDKHADVDMVLHLGDISNQKDQLETAVNCPVKVIAGNNDYSADLPKECLFDIEGYNILMIHGHEQRVYNGTAYLKQYADYKGADIVLFGHTHMPHVEEDGGLLVVNPGSLTIPRQPGHIPTYAVMTIENEDVNVVIEDIK